MAFALKSCGSQVANARVTRQVSAARPAFVRPAAPMLQQKRMVKAYGKVKKITGEELEVVLANRDRTVIVDFFATWCGPCLLLATEMEKVAEQLGDAVEIVKIDVDENPALSSALRIEGLPTIVFIPKDGSKPALRTEGLLPAQQIIDIVKDL